MTAAVQLHHVPLSLSMTMTMSPALPLWLSLYVLEPSYGKFHVITHTILYLMDNTAVEHVSLLPGTHSQDCVQVILVEG